MEREADKDSKTSVPAEPLCEILPLPEIAKDTEEGSSQSVEKPLCTPCLRAKLIVPPTAFTDLTEFTEDTEGGVEKALKNLCAKFCLSLRSQRTQRGEQSKR